MSTCLSCGEENAPGIELCRRCGAKIPPPPETEAPAEPFSAAAIAVIEALRSGRKIEAIKLYRAETGCGLKEAKDAVEELARRHGLEAVARGGCSTVLLAVALVALASAAVVRLICLA